MGVVTHSINPLALLEEVRDERLAIIAELDTIKDALKKMDRKVERDGLHLSDASKNSMRLRLDINKAMAQIVQQKITSLGSLIELKMLLDEIQKELKSLQDAMNVKMTVEQAKEAVVGKDPETGDIKVYKKQGRPKGAKDKKPRTRRPNNG